MTWKILVRATAKLILLALHPGIVFVAVVAIAAYDTAGTSSEWLRWTAATLVAAYGPPMLYLKVRLDMLREASVSPVSLHLIFPEHPEELVAVACLFAGSSFLALGYMGRLEILLNVVATTAGTMLAVALVGVIRKTSFHLALVTGMLSSLWPLVGVSALATLPLIALLAFTRHRLGMETREQVMAGAVLGFLVALVVLRGLAQLV